MPKYSEAEELLKEFIEDIKVAYCDNFEGKEDELDEDLLNWPDLVLTYEKVIKYFKGKE